MYHTNTNALDSNLCGKKKGNTIDLMLGKRILAHMNTPPKIKIKKTNRKQLMSRFDRTKK